MASVEELCDNIALINKAEKILDGSVAEIKRQYKSNIYEISFPSADISLKDVLDGNFEVLSESKEAYTGKAIVRINNGMPSNHLIAALLPHISINSFTERIPSMNDIFIAKVTQNGQFANANNLTE
ncbi:MAG: hypothetical protein BWY70_00865 [Bacteroidetes bacterium ADurb.Bin408]|nr:MAG: hypothetical protein BWY70_00865 [Bacteroidetes bacterium ADurb.Bin408]